MSCTTNTRSLKFWQVFGVGLCAVLLAGCGTSTEPADEPAPATQSATPTADPSPEVEAPEDVAVKVMTLFARPDEPEQRWFAELRPYLEEEYAVEAEYIDPARIPFDKILSGPVMDGTEHNPQVVTADFKTNAGTWYVELHQNGPGGKWLVGGIHKLDKS